MPSPGGSCGPVCLEVALRSATVTLVRDPGEQTTRIKVTGPADMWDDEPDRAAIEQARRLMDIGEYDAALLHLGQHGQARLLVWDASPHDGHVTITHAPKVSRTTEVRLDAATATTLREIAAAFGYVTTRGTGAGESGNPAALLDVLALCWKQQPDETARQLAEMIAGLARRAGR